MISIGLPLFRNDFAPAKNPQMWSETLYTEMKRLSVTGSTVATFTAAGDVRRGLEGVGFDIDNHSPIGAAGQSVSLKTRR